MALKVILPAERSLAVLPTPLQPRSFLTLGYEAPKVKLPPGHIAPRKIIGSASHPLATPLLILGSGAPKVVLPSRPCCTTVLIFPRAQFHGAPIPYPHSHSPILRAGLQGAPLEFTHSHFPVSRAGYQW